MDEKNKNQNSAGRHNDVSAEAADHPKHRKWRMPLEMKIMHVLIFGSAIWISVFFYNQLSIMIKNTRNVLGIIRGNSSVLPDCSLEVKGKKVLPYLWCSRGLCRGTRECIVKDGHFSVQIIGYWQQKPTVEKQSDWNYRYRFMNSDSTKNKQWISIEYMDPPSNISVDGDIAVWVNTGLMFTGKPVLNVPDKQEFSLLKFVKVQENDPEFMKKHGLKQMASWMGTIRIGDTVCCVYIVAMQKGRRSWKMEVVFPAAREKAPGKTANGKVSAPVADNAEELARLCFLPINTATAGLWMGHFKIID